MVKLVFHKDLCLFSWEPKCHSVVTLTMEETFTPREDSHLFLKIVFSSVEEIKIFCYWVACV